MGLSQIKAIRAIALPLLAKFNLGDITIKHHFTGDCVRLHSYKHKGYWYHGKNRERATMELFERLIKCGDTVIEVGGHIGYISLYFKHLVGSSGKVIVFEPGENNLPYLLKNIEGKGVEVVQKAVGKEEGTCSFFLDKLSGQNNSMVEEFFMRKKTETNAFDPESTGSREVRVEVVTLDRWIGGRAVKPDFVKIDIEGFEYNALLGMKQMIAQHRPILMVEVQMNQREIDTFFESLGYAVLQENGQRMPYDLIGNVFCFHREKHKNLIESLGK